MLARAGFVCGSCLLSQRSRHSHSCSARIKHAQHGRTLAIAAKVQLKVLAHEQAQDSLSNRMSHAGPTKRKSKCSAVIAVSAPSASSTLAFTNGRSKGSSLDASSISLLVETDEHYTKLLHKLLGGRSVESPTPSTSRVPSPASVPFQLPRTVRVTPPVVGPHAAARPEEDERSEEFLRAPCR